MDGVRYRNRSAMCVIVAFDTEIGFSRNSLDRSKCTTNYG